MKIPVVFFIYNRPEITQRVFEEIRKFEPAQLFVVADGSKNDSDQKLVDQTRKIIKKIDWNCQVKTNLSNTNLGCAYRIISGLDWVFNHTEKAIILEDDCLPDPTFFRYCEDLLNFFENDHSIMHISGFNILKEIDISQSYFFSKFILPPWGWATWKRAWSKFNKNLDTWQKIKTTAYKNIAQDYFTDWTNMFENIRQNKTTWDTPWNVDIWKQMGFGIIPQRNLIENIGFDKNATFTKNPASELSKIPRLKMDFPLIHTNERNCIFDKRIEQKIIDSVRLNDKYNSQ